MPKVLPIPLGVRHTDSVAINYAISIALPLAIMTIVVALFDRGCLLLTL
jgi:hypothetical protein